MVSSHQFNTWDHRPLCWCEETMVLYRKRVVPGLMYGIGVKIPWCCMDRVVYGLELWSLHTNSIHETIDHCICIMVSSHQFHTWDQGPFYLSIQQHGLFMPIMYGIGEKRPWCCIEREWSLVSCMELVWRYHDVVWTEWSMVWNWCENTMMFNSIHETIDHSLYIQHHGVFTPIPDHRPLCPYNIMVSSHQFHTWDQGPLYSDLWSHVWNWREETMVLYRQSGLWSQHHGLFTPIQYMRPGTTLSLCNIMVSSHQFHT
jgi:hypothetical protein